MRQLSARRAKELEHYLNTGEHDDPLFGAWRGQNDGPVEADCSRAVRTVSRVSTGS
jgi:hypothetical protein